MRHNKPKQSPPAPIKSELKVAAMTPAELKAYYNSAEYKEWVRLAAREYHIKVD